MPVIAYLLMYCQGVQKKLQSDFTICHEDLSRTLRLHPALPLMEAASVKSHNPLADRYRKPTSFQRTPSHSYSITMSQAHSGSS